MLWHIAKALGVTVGPFFEDENVSLGNDFHAQREPDAKAVCIQRQVALSWSIKASLRRMKFALKILEMFFGFLFEPNDSR